MATPVMLIGARTRSSISRVLPKSATSGAVTVEIPAFGHDHGGAPGGQGLDELPQHLA